MKALHLLSKCAFGTSVQTTSLGCWRAPSSVGWNPCLCCSAPKATLWWKYLFWTLLRDAEWYMGDTTWLAEMDAQLYTRKGYPCPCGYEQLTLGEWQDEDATHAMSSHYQHLALFYFSCSLKMSGKGFSHLLKWIMFQPRSTLMKWSTACPCSQNATVCL